MGYDIFDLHEGQGFAPKIALWPRQWKRFPQSIKLSWHCVRYEKTMFSSLPDSPGVYAFVLKPNIGGLSELGYLLYIGKAEGQSLKKRCPQYLYEIKRKKPRLHIQEMFFRWGSCLHLYFAAVSTGLNVSQIEDQLLEAFVPPMNRDLPGRLQAVADVIYRS